MGKPLVYFAGLEQFKQMRVDFSALHAVFHYFQRLGERYLLFVWPVDSRERFKEIGYRYNPGLQGELLRNELQRIAFAIQFLVMAASIDRNILEFFRERYLVEQVDSDIHMVVHDFQLCGREAPPPYRKIQKFVIGQERGRFAVQQHALRMHLL